MRKLLLAICVLLSGCSVHIGPTTDDLYSSIPRGSYGYVDPDRGYLRMRATSGRWRAFDDDFYYWNFGPGLTGVGSPFGGWNTWRWYSPGFPYYGSGLYPWHGANPWGPYSIYGGWNAWPVTPPLGIGGPWGTLPGWSPSHRPTITTGIRDPRPATAWQSPRQVNLGAYGTGTQRAQQDRTGTAVRTFGATQPGYTPRMSTQSQGTPNNGAPRSAPVRKFDRP